MQQAAVRLDWCRANLLLFGTVTGTIPLWLYLRTRAPTISWGNGGADGGDLAAAVVSGGIAHPPGYPTYTLVGVGWSILAPDPDPAGRLVLLSVASAVLASLVLFITTVRLAAWCGFAPAGTPIAGALAGIGWALGPIGWSQAVIVEVYAHGMLWLSVALLLLLSASATALPIWRAASLGLILGLGFGALPQIVLLLPGMMMAIGRRWLRQPAVARRSMALGAGGLLGLAVFLALPLRAERAPYASWGGLSTAQAVVAFVSASQYRDLSSGLTPAIWAVRLAESLLLLGREVMALTPFALLGAVHVTRRQPERAVIVIGLLASTVMFRAAYLAEGNVVYLLPATYTVCLLAGVGISWVLTELHARLPRRWPVLLAGAALGFLVAAPVPFTLPGVDVHDDLRFRQFGEAVISTAAQGSIVVTEHDETTFALWYRQALRERPDLVVIDARLLTHHWYQRQLAERHPDLDERALRPGGLTALPRAVYLVRFDPSSQQPPFLESVR